LDSWHVTVASLLHDVGKVIYRGVSEARRQRMSHQTLGFVWASERGYPEPILEAIRRHHWQSQGSAEYEQLAAEAYQGPQRVRNLLYVVREADRLAAAMEREPFDEGGFDLSASLCNIFSTIQLDGQKSPSPTQWPLDRDAYPEEKVVLLPAERERMWSNLQEDLSKLGRRPDPTSLLYVLQKHLSRVPEHTWVRASPPDTSLYHHLKTTAAIALAMWRHGEHSENCWSSDMSGFVADRSLPRYLLIGGDVSGVQDFIYRVSSRRALRLLRAKSFFLELFCEWASTHFVEALGLERTSIVYAGGGRFVLLGPQTARAQKTIQRTAREVNDWLWNAFSGALYLAVAAVPMTGEELVEDTGAGWDRLEQGIADAKACRWPDRLATLFIPREVPDEECDACRLPAQHLSREGEDEPALCDFCSQMVRLGGRLPELDQLWVVDACEAPADATVLSIGNVAFTAAGPGRLRYLLRDHWRQLSAEELQRPTVALPVAALESGIYEREMDAVAAASVGVPKVGVLRMDVDRLGAIFREGLQKRSFARISELSDRLNTYFKYHLPRRLACLLEGEHEPTLFGLRHRQPALNLIYAGGDDLFILGPWDQIVDLAFAIRRDFARYTGENPAVTLSGGLVVVDHRLAVYRAADLAGQEEDRAKRAGRNRLALLGSVVPWEDGKEMRQLLAAWKKDTEEPREYVLRYSRSLLQRLLRLLEREDEWSLVQLYYLLRGADARRLLRVVLPGVGSSWLRPALRLVDLACRKGAER